MMLKIGDVAKKTGVSVRSLRHYDEIGLLQPSHHSEAGYRLYTKTDILRLQQIVSFKQMGFSLKKIHSMLNEDAVDLQETLRMQLEFLQQQLQQQQHVCKQVKHVLDLVASRSEVSLEIIYETLEAIKMLEQYYTQEQIESLKKRSFYMDEKAEENYGKAWEEVFTGLAKLEKEGVPANDPKTKPFAQSAKDLIAAFTEGDEGIQKSLHNMYHEVGGGQMLRNHGVDVSDALFDYYHRAMHAHGMEADLPH